MRRCVCIGWLAPPSSRWFHTGKKPLSAQSERKSEPRTHALSSDATPAKAPPVGRVQILRLVRGRAAVPPAPRCARAGRRRQHLSPEQPHAQAGDRGGVPRLRERVGLEHVAAAAVRAEKPRVELHGCRAGRLVVERHQLRAALPKGHRVVV
eukprot:5296510-Pleurochrysis_carterae.AAC.1